MKTLVFTDPKGDFETLKRLRDFADSHGDISSVVAIGSIAGPVYTEDDRVKMARANQSLYSLRCHPAMASYQSSSLSSIAQMALEGSLRESLRHAPGTHGIITANAQVYQELLEKAAPELEAQYAQFRDLWTDFLPNSLVILPGDIDSTILDAYLRDQNALATTLSKRQIPLVQRGTDRKLDCVGYGGSTNPGFGNLPLDLIPEAFDDDRLHQVLNEADGRNADIVITNMPSKGIMHFNIPHYSLMPIGSYAVSSWVQENNPVLLLCGVGNLPNVQRLPNGTVVINPGVLGRPRRTLDNKLEQIDPTSFVELGQTREIDKRGQPEKGSEHFISLPIYYKGRKTSPSGCFAIVDIDDDGFFKGCNVHQMEFDSDRIDEIGEFELGDAGLKSLPKTKPVARPQTRSSSANAYTPIHE
ncbi:MAG: hypothetical protein WC796_04465 [Candidatus Pacearchaeota archaeon]|jgi:Icc-related predicted phosphoesterase